uniref:Uncharacterized protein n=1 Tax=Neovison vison TaxID=452646 RepID=A0A8C7AUH3_NEOVI
MAFLLATWGLDSGFVPSVQSSFAKKLTGAHTYLQILKEHLTLFDDKLQNCKYEQRKKIEALKETTNSMVELIKHCIVLQQIAKSTINFADATYQSSPWEPVINTMLTLNLLSCVSESHACLPYQLDLY